MATLPLLAGACGDAPAGSGGTTTMDTSAGDSTSAGAPPTTGDTTNGPTSESTNEATSLETGDTSSSSGVDLPSEPPASSLIINVVSSRADMVTGGDALVEVRFPAEVSGDEIAVLAGEEDVTENFEVVGDGRMLGVIEGLALGETVVEANAPGEEAAQLVVTNYPITGPMISGPHQTPFVCRNEASGMGAPLDANCSSETRYEYFYKNVQNQLMPLADPLQVPADVLKVQLPDGPMIDYIARVERGTINRAVYQISTLWDPTAPEWTATSPQAHWGGKAFYHFRGGCGEGHHQGVLGPADDIAGVFFLIDIPISHGYAVLSSTLNTLGTSCNDVLTAETAMMVKERFIERYGAPRLTMGWGGSGGSIQQHTLAENYPGVLDGIVPSVSYPDIMSIYPDVMDCPLWLYYLNVNSQGMFNNVADQAEVLGFASDQTCVQWFTSFGHFEDPTKGCDASVPADQIYHPVNNPDGVRCTYVDNLINLIGEDPNTGAARKIYDNVGVQYGLRALNDGKISKAQFLHINAKFGGYGKDGGPQTARTAADPEALRAAYEGGRITRGDLGLRSVPIVDLRYYTDLTGDIHDRIRTYSTRERLLRANGHFNNHVTFMGSQAAAAQVGYAAFLSMDKWLVALAAADRTDLPAAVVATKPAEVVDLCIVDPNMPAIPGDCAAELPIHSSPRMTAGAPLTNDILKCALKPIDPADYAVQFTAMELQQLAATFPDGVCDWDAPGVMQVPALGTWQSFGPRP